MNARLPIGEAGDPQDGCSEFRAQWLPGVVDTRTFRAVFTLPNECPSSNGANDPIVAELGARRLELGLSRAELADKSGLSADYIRRVENGNHELSVVSYAKLAVALGLDASEVLGVEVDERISERPESEKQLLAALGKRITALRKARGLTQRELADLLQLNPVSISRIENGHLSFRVGLSTRVRLALHNNK